MLTQTYVAIWHHWAIMSFNLNIISVTSDERHVVWNHRSFVCLFNSLCGPTSKEHQSPPYWPFVTGIHRLPGYQWSPTQRAINAEKATISWHHHDIGWTVVFFTIQDVYLSSNIISIWFVNFNLMIINFSWLCYKFWDLLISETKFCGVQILRAMSTLTPLSWLEICEIAMANVVSHYQKEQMWPSIFHLDGLSYLEKSLT